MSEPEPPEELVEKPRTPLPELKPRRTTLFTIIRDFVRRHTHSEKPDTTDTSNLSSLAASPLSFTMTLRDDMPDERPSTATEPFATKQMKNWSCSDVKEFLRKYQLDKFSKILSQNESGE
jgi:hypothetical protein